MASHKIDQSITFLPADKGGAIVVLDRNAYIQKIEQPLSYRETTYKLLRCDPMTIQVTSVGETIDRLVREESIARLAKSAPRWLPSTYNCLPDRLALSQPREMDTRLP